MKKYLFGLLAVVFAVGAIAFKSVPTNKADQTNYYFKFVGTAGSQEADVEKWDNITSGAYTLTTCDQAKQGCKLITTAVQTINGFVRPSTVPLSPGTFNPIVSGPVTAVSNKIP